MSQPTHFLAPTVYDRASLSCSSALPARKIESSDQLGWTSALVEHHQLLPFDGAFETVPTGDHTIVVMTRGEQVLSSFERGEWRSELYRPGTVGITPAGMSERLRRRINRDLGPACKVNIYLPQQVFADATERLRRAGTPAPTAMPSLLGRRDELVREAALGLLRAMRAGAPDLYAQATVSWLALHLLMAEDGTAAGENGRREVIIDRRLGRVRDLIDQHYATELSLDDLAAEAGVSKYHFSRLFQQATGTSPHRYLIDRRLEAARRVLAAEDVSIAEVARRCGFKQANHFSTQFARRFGLSPGDHRHGARREG